VLRGLESGNIRVVARDLTEPSPLALEALNARPYAYLDDAPLEERRTQAVMSRRWLDPTDAADIGKLDAAAIARVRTEAWPDADTADELHDALLWLTFMTDPECHANAAWPRLMEQLSAAGRVVKIRTQHAPLWVASERRALFAHGGTQVDVSAPTDESLVEIVRGRLEGLGPVTAASIAESLSATSSSVNIALTALEVEGFAMRGRYTGGAVTEEWCERRLLARIHRYTVKRLRAEIEAVPAKDFVRFLCEWQRVLPDAQAQGSDALAAVLSQLEGFEAPAAAWESEIIPTRIAEYDPGWLDEHCRAGRFMWTRLAARSAAVLDGARPAPGGPAPAVAPIRTTPVVLLARRHASSWSSLVGPPDGSLLTSRAQAVVDVIKESGASFFEEITEHACLLPSEAEGALAELVAVGLVSSDSFAGLRALLMPNGRRGQTNSYGRKVKRRMALFAMADAGRWALVRRSRVAAESAEQKDQAVEQVVRTLLRRWGVIFWKLLSREAHWLPPWREILYCCRRLEARGEIRGGRFVAGFSGEQFATPEAVGLLREVRRKAPTQQYLSVSAADPLNLLGILSPGARLTSLAGNRLLYRDGLPVALYAAGEVRFLENLAPEDRWEAQIALLRRQAAVTRELEGTG
jgi:ATP-dependent Lhr-like helicase